MTIKKTVFHCSMGEIVEKEIKDYLFYGLTTELNLKIVNGTIVYSVILVLSGVLK